MSTQTSIPERNVPLPYGFSDIDGLIYGQARGVQKFFTDPDFVHLNLDRDFKPGEFEIDWATPLGALETVRILGDFIKESSFKKARIGLRNSHQREGAVIGGSTNVLNAEIDDALAEIRESNERVMFFELENKELRINWMPFWGVDFHDIPTNQTLLHVSKPGTIERLAIDECMSLTSYPELQASLDQTLDEFAQYEPGLAK